MRFNQILMVEAPAFISFYPPFGGYSAVLDLGIIRDVILLPPP
jgi:hypothetical protein